MTHDTPEQAKQPQQSDSTDELAIVSEEEVSVVSREECVEKTGSPVSKNVGEKRADFISATEDEESSKATVSIVNSDVSSLGVGHNDKADSTPTSMDADAVSRNKPVSFNMVPDKEAGTRSIVTEKEKAATELSSEGCSPNDRFLV